MKNESQGQVHRPERVNQCTSPYDPPENVPHFESLE